jgi:hypothetical protein
LNSNDFSIKLTNQGTVVANTEKTKMNLVASSIDGHISFWEFKQTKNWDSYDLQWKPFIKPSTVSADGTHDYSCTKINLRCISNRTDSQADLGTEHTILSTKFFGGCDDGDIIYADWYSEKADDKGKH